ncbi:MAG: hypothetical protein DMG63_19480 [Acidobacteria bacterium]|nr:MAG: hypothetical protein DMG63_19480 [Acidobacteriota bacterium]
MKPLLIGLVMAATLIEAQSESADYVTQMQDFPVIEFRRYTIKAGEREHFAQYFETYFPEAIQQAGAIAFGEFFERADPSRFTWIRGFHDVDGRAAANGALYNGPLSRKRPNQRLRTIEKQGHTKPACSSHSTCRTIFPNCPSAPMALFSSGWECSRTIRYSRRNSSHSPIEGLSRCPLRACYVARPN